MKKIYLTISTIILASSLSGQNMDCEVDGSPSDKHFKTVSQFKNNESCNNTIRLHFYLLRENDGSGGRYEYLHNVGEVASEDDYVNQHLDLLNEAFAFSAYTDKIEQEAHSGINYGEDIQFVSEGWDYFDNSTLLHAYNPSVTQLIDFESSNTAINIYLGTSGNRSVSQYPSDVLDIKGTNIYKDNVLTNIVVHEIGHSLGLIHPFENVGHFNPTTGDYEAEHFEQSEVYTLTSDYPFGEGCETQNDHVCDTYPTIVMGSDDNCEYALNFYNGNAALMPLVVGEPLNINDLESYDTFPYARLEENGDPYQFRQHDNFMSYVTKCMSKFTPGQSQRMNGFLDGVNSLFQAYSDLSFTNVHSVEITPISGCGENDGVIEITVPKGVTVSELSDGSVINSSIDGILTLNNLGNGSHDFVVVGTTQCEMYYFTESLFLQECAFDFSSDNIVNITDLLTVTSLLGRKCCPADFNNDNVVNTIDELQLLMAIEENICTVGDCPEDLNYDGVLDNLDFEILTSQIGEKCTCCVGDGNHDGNINVLDLVGVVSRLGLTCTENKDAFSAGTFEENHSVTKMQFNAMIDAVYFSELSESEKEQLTDMIRSKVKIKHESLHNMELYPSPASEYVVISYNAPALNLQILNVQGQVVLEKNITAKNVKLDVSQLTNGVYIVRDAESRVEEKKLIIAR